jgi:hypothetical protein
LGEERGKGWCGATCLVEIAHKHTHKYKEANRGLRVLIGMGKIVQQCMDGIFLCAIELK